MARYTYRFYNVLSKEYIGELEMHNVTFNRPVRGTGSFSGSVVVEPRNVDLVRSCLDFRLALMVVYKDDVPFWPGFVTKRTWKSKDSTIDVDAAKARSILNTAMLRPQFGYDEAFNLTLLDTPYSWTLVEQTRIVREIVQFATAGEPGMPQIRLNNTDTTPIQRDYHTTGMAFKYAGEVMDTISSRSNGFDWDVEVRESFDGEGVELYLATWYPERNTGVNTLYLEFDPQGDGNIIDFGDIEESAEQYSSRVYATGEGTPPSQPVAVDTDPQAQLGYQLLRERMTNYSSVVEIATLASHARAERAALGVPVDILNLRIKPELLTTAFDSGDRARLKIKDLWLDMDLPRVRIVDTSIAPFDRGQGEAVGVAVDLSDLTLPAEESEEEEV